jgi:hypothetical protein
MAKKKKDTSVPKNTGIPYEIVTKAIYEKMLVREDVKNLTIKHNASVTGKTFTHQIDVYWRFTAAGIEHQVCVQCKDWADNVPVGAVHTFIAVLADIPGQPHGVMIAKTGFQQGAADVAAQHGIDLFTLRKPQTDADWDGILRKIVFNITAQQPKFDNIRFNQDEACRDAEKKRLDLAAGEAVHLQVTPMDGISTCDEYGHPQQTMPQVLTAVLRANKTTETPTHVEYTFPEPTYFYTSGDARVPYIRFTSIEADISHITFPMQQTVVSADDIVSYILANVTTGAKVAINMELDMLLPPDE